MHNFVLQNSEWIQGQLDISPLINSSNDNPQQPEAKFLLGGNKEQEKQFNPLLEYCNIGDSKFDHVSTCGLVLVFVNTNFIERFLSIYSTYCGAFRSHTLI